MKPDDFEQKLQRQPLRQVPAGWRADILAACPASGIESRKQERHWLSTLNSRLSTLLWPHPAAWAGLAAVWIFIFAVNFSMRDKMPSVAEKFSPPSPEMIAELRQQQRMFMEMLGSRDAVEAEPPKFVPQPRGERVEFLTA